MNGQTLIDLQVYQNRNINPLAQRQQTGFVFSPAAQELLTQIASGKMSKETEAELLRYTVRSVLAAFHRINQYYRFTKEAEADLTGIYQTLVQVVKTGNEPLNFASLAEAHYRRLQLWLRRHQPEAAVLFPPGEATVAQPVACAEYSAATQLQTLHLSINTLKGPILDLGCGKEQHLLQFLWAQHCDAYGIDREAETTDRVMRTGWLHHPFQAGHWGTIISHLGFSNHFRHHYLKSGDEHLLYARKYVEILQSLKQEGRFHYAPDLPFIEALLPESQYSVQKTLINGTPFYATAVQRIA